MSEIKSWVWKSELGEERNPIKIRRVTKSEQKFLCVQQTALVIKMNELTLN